MLNTQVNRIILENPEFKAISPVIEKEILHHDIIDAMTKFGALQSLTFIGGTSLRMCYNSARLSEDLDFNAGHHFKPADFEGLDTDIQRYIQNKYETEVWVNKPSEKTKGNTSSWKISIIKEANRPDLPRQKMHIDVCAIPSFDIKKSTLINHYNITVPTEGLLVPVQTLEETMVDKLIAFAYRSRRIKPRDVWDLGWIKQRGVQVSLSILERKLEAREKIKDDFINEFQTQLNSLLVNDETKRDFISEMTRFIPLKLKARTLDNPEYWDYLQSEIKDLARLILKPKAEKNFDMGN